MGTRLAEFVVVKLVALLSLLLACNDNSTAAPDAMGSDEFAHFCEDLKIGPRGAACFDLELGDTERVIAEHAHTDVEGYVRTTGSVSASADDPTLFHVGAVTLSDGTSVHPFSLVLTAASAGDGDVVLRDDAGAEIDRLTLHARPSDALVLDANLSTPPLVLANEVTTLHVTTTTAGRTTVGTGAVDFTPSGGVTAATSADAPWLDDLGDTGFVRVVADGSIQAHAPDAIVNVAVTAVPASALTTIAADPLALSIASGDSKSVTIGATAGSIPVYGPRCTWSNMAGLTITLPTGFYPSNVGLGGVASYHYTIEGQAGDYQPICTLPGGLSVTLHVHVAA